MCLCIILITQTIIREGAKAANIWNNPPLIKDLTPNEAKKFYETVSMRVTNNVIYIKVNVTGFHLMPTNEVSSPSPNHQAE